MTDEQKLKANLGPKMRSKTEEKKRLTNLNFRTLYDDTNYDHIFSSHYGKFSYFSNQLANIGIILMSIENAINH